MHCALHCPVHWWGSTLYVSLVQNTCWGWIKYTSRTKNKLSYEEMSYIWDCLYLITVIHDYIHSFTHMWSAYNNASVQRLQHADITGTCLCMTLQLCRPTKQQCRSNDELMSTTIFHVSNSAWLSTVTHWMYVVHLHLRSVNVHTSEKLTTITVDWCYLVLSGVCLLTLYNMMDELVTESFASF